MKGRGEKGEGGGRKGGQSTVVYSEGTAEDVKRILRRLEDGEAEEYRRYKTASNRRAEERKRGRKGGGEG